MASPSRGLLGTSKLAVLLVPSEIKARIPRYPRKARACKLQNSESQGVSLHDSGDSNAGSCAQTIVPVTIPVDVTSADLRPLLNAFLAMRAISGPGVMMMRIAIARKGRRGINYT